VIIKEISSLKLRKIYRKGCQVFAVHMEEAPMDKMSSVEDCIVLKEFEDIFKEIPSFPPKRDIDFSINMMSIVAPISKIPYRMSTLELKEL
jgi:hypothetical protein